MVDVFEDGTLFRRRDRTTAYDAKGYSFEREKFTFRILGGLTMKIDALKELMPPPDEPLYPGSLKEWREFQERTGIRFPEDYFAISHTYGSGRFLAGEFKVANPFDPDDEKFSERELATLHETRSTSPKDVPYPLYPEQSGLYPFGIDGNGNTFLWITDDDPNAWAIACFNSEDHSESVNHSLVEFLVLLATNKLKIQRRKFWGNDFSADHLEFVPRRLPRQRKRM
jgi:hypothetical protein